MAVIRPFRALRPTPEKAKEVSCVPYDVIDETEARGYIEENPLSFLRVTRPEAAVSEGSDSDINSDAKQLLEKLTADGVFVREAEDSFYIYRISVGDHSQTGVVACCSIDEYDEGLIKRHEKTRPDKVKDRTDHMLDVGAQTGLIFLAFRGTTAIRQLIVDETASEPLFDFPCSGGERHTVWRVTRTREMTEAFAEVPNLYIADGHHRAESASRARATLREVNPAHTGNEDYNSVIAGIFPAEDLKILAYNRVVADLNGHSESEFIERLSPSFIVTQTSAKTPAHRSEVCMYLGGKWYLLKFAVDFVKAPDPIEALDVSILQDYVLRPLLGIDDPRTDKRIGFVGGSRGTEELEVLVDRGEAKVAFSMFPTTMSDLFAVSDMDEIMPPKSTWFAPKLRDGLLVHLI